MSERYNGWTNYETWNVKLWIDNDQGSERYWADAAQEAFDDATANATFTRKERAEHSLAEKLKDEISEHPLLDQCSMYCDLLGAALS